MLRQRVITALLIGLPILGVLLFAPPLWMVLVLAVILLRGAWEWSGFLQTSLVWLRLLYVAAIAVVMYFWCRTSVVLYPEVFLQIAIGWWVIALLYIVFVPEMRRLWLICIAGLLVLLPMWVALTTLADHHGHGGQLILCLLLLVAATDIGAYFAGRALGKHKLAPRVSPGKTWEGVVGGLLSAVLIAMIAAHWFGIAMIPFVGLCLITAAFSIIGDLTESLFKRHAGLKDSSSILPGHGGVLDRIDSITAAAPVFVYGLMQLNVVTL